MKVWLTKYALTRGLEQVSDKHWQITPETGGRDWCEEHAAAIAIAERMRIAKIASLEKQIAKLRRLRFDTATAPLSPEPHADISDIPFLPAEDHK